ncbi:hypothetical protein [Brumimicrobium sp.]|uniref:hypothetical protein n=1 Tax=Brumimicrobium sp. TaxID=2029867 RepID=UPI0026241A45|nr:hypothetical protein [uncultured Brumimicrobium sp.]
MDKLLDFIERHKYGIVITLLVHVGLFIYFQVATYKEVILFEPWDFQSVMDEAPDDIEITPDQIQTPQEQQLFNPQEEVSSFVKNENDTREESQSKDIKFTSYSQSGNPEQIENQFEQQLKDEIRRKREERESKNPSTSTDVDKKPKKDPVQNTSSGGEASEKAAGGATMVSYSLAGRHPLNYNDWYVRNPGYTCGNVNGVVKVAISVDEGGHVISATVIEGESQNATACMKQRSREYALMSRFNYSNKAPKKQEGVITYRFVYR